MKPLIITILLFFSSFVFAQNLSVLKIKVLYSNSNKPVAYKEAVLYNGAVELEDAFIFEDGTFAFVIDDTTFSHSDSIHFCINDDTLGNNDIWINNLRLLEWNKTSVYSIKITDFMYFTINEYDEYCKKNGLMPRRKNTLAKDVK